jgi:hypothetical protein
MIQIQDLTLEQVQHWTNDQVDQFANENREIIILACEQHFTKLSARNADLYRISLLRSRTQLQIAQEFEISRGFVGKIINETRIGIKNYICDLIKQNQKQYSSD